MGKIIWGSLSGMAIVAFAIIYKMGKVDNLEAKQVIYDSRLTRYDTRMDGYDRSLESVRIDAMVSKKLLEDVKEDTRQIRQLLLNQK